MIYALAIFIFLRPFICSPAFPKINLFYAIALFIFLLIWILLKKPRLPEKNIFGGIMAFSGSLAIAAILTKSPTSMLMNVLQYMSGILLFLICRVMPYAQTDKILQTIIASGITICLLGLHQFFFDFPGTLHYLNNPQVVDPLVTQFIQQKRVYSVLITPNTLGAYLIMLLPLFLFLRNKIWLLPLGGVLILTKSIGTFLTLLITFPFYAYQRRLSNLSIFFLFLGVILTSIGIIWWRSSTPTHDFNPGFSLDMRWQYWKETWAIIKLHPITGIGLGNFNLPDARYTHNLFLQLWAETGIAGMLSFIYLISLLLHKAWQTMNTTLSPQRPTALFFAVTVFLVHNMIDFSFFLPEVSLIWCVLLGLACNPSAPPDVASMPVGNNSNQTKSL